MILFLFLIFVYIIVLCVPQPKKPLIISLKRKGLFEIFFVKSFKILYQNFWYFNIYTYIFRLLPIIIFITIFIPFNHIKFFTMFFCIFLFLLGYVYIYFLNLYKQKLLSNFKKYVTTITTKYLLERHFTFDLEDQDDEIVSNHMDLQIDIFIDLYIKNIIKRDKVIEYLNTFPNFTFLSDKYNLPKNKNWHNNLMKKPLESLRIYNMQELQLILDLELFVTKCNYAYKDVLEFLFLFLCLIFYSFISLSILIIRFFRPRVPQDIPFDLDDLSFYILLGICIAQIYVIYRLLYPKPIPPVIIKIVQKVLYPIIYIKNKVIYDSKIYPYYHRLLFDNILPKILQLSDTQYFTMIFLCKLLPKILLLIILIIDILVYQKLQLFYYFLCLHIITLVYYSINTALQKSMEYFIDQLDSKYGLVNIRTKEAPFYSVINIRTFLEVSYINDPNRNYLALDYIHIKPDVMKEYQIKHDNFFHFPDERGIITNDFYKYITILYQLKDFLKRQADFELRYHLVFWTIIIHLLTLFCWVFILGISMYVFPPDFHITLEILHTILKNMNKINPY